jgi:hypothetical protein
MTLFSRAATNLLILFRLHIPADIQIYNRLTGCQRTHVRLMYANNHMTLRTLCSRRFRWQTGLPLKKNKYSFILFTIHMYVSEEQDQ